MGIGWGSETVKLGFQNQEVQMSPTDWVTRDRMWTERNSYDS